MPREPVFFADVEAWAVSYLSTQLAAYPATQGVLVAITVPSTRQNRMVIVRRDGGPQTGPVTETARLGINLWDLSNAAVSALATHVRALLAAADNDGPARGARVTGHASLPDDAPHKRRYMTAEVTLRSI